MSADTQPARTTADRPPAWMPPPPPGTGLTTSAPAQAPVAQAPVAKAATAEPAPSAAAATARTGRAGALLTRGAIWGALGMGAAALLQMWASATGGDEAVRPLRLMTTLIEGGPGLVDGPPIVGIGINVLIGVVLGVLFALVTPRLRSSRAVLLGALVLGAGVFAVDAYLIATQLPLLELRDEPLLLASRLVLGAVLALGFLPGRGGPAAP